MPTNQNSRGVRPWNLKKTVNKQKVSIMLTRQHLNVADRAYFGLVGSTYPCAETAKPESGLAVSCFHTQAWGGF